MSIGFGHSTQERREPSSIDFRTVIACARGSEASYQTGAANTGSVSFISWATNDVLRVQNRGTRDAVFIEGSRTNYFQRSRDMTNATPSAWTGGSMAQTANAAQGVDASMVAAQFNGTGSQFSARQSVTPGAGAIMSIWARAVSTTQPLRHNYAYPNGTGGIATLSTTYSRYSSRVATLTTHTDYVHDCSIGGATNIYVDCAQCEVGGFASSLIRTTTATVTRSADVCTIASPPSWMRSGKFSITIAPESNSIEFIRNATEQTLFAFGTGTNDRIAMIVDGGMVKIRVIQGGATKVTTSPISFSRWKDITIVFDAILGYIVVTGADTGDNVYTGTAWTMQTGTVYVGNVSGGTTPYFGEILPTAVRSASTALVQSWTPQQIAATPLIYLSGQHNPGLDGGSLDWLDETGNLRHGTNSAVAAQPAYLTSAAYGNHEVMDFDGSSDFLQTTSVAGGHNTITLAWIGHADSVTGVRKIVETVTGGAGAFSFFVEGSKLSVWANGAAGQDYVAGNTTIVTGTRYLFIVEIPFSALASSTIATWVNGVSQTQTIIANTATNTTAITALWQIGRWVSAASQYWDGMMAVLGAWIGTFTPTERANFLTFAQTYYGVP